MNDFIFALFKPSHKTLFLVADIGGSHIAAALCDNKGKILDKSFHSLRLSHSEKSISILDLWVGVLSEALAKKGNAEIVGVGVSIPGPFDYEKGTCLRGWLNKHEDFYGRNLKEYFMGHLPIAKNIPFLFANDASCFGLGESLEINSGTDLIAVTLGRGLGGAFVRGHTLVKTGEAVPPNGYLFNTDFKNGVAEDYISCPWLEDEYSEWAGKQVSVKEMAEKAIYRKDEQAIALFEVFGENLAKCLSKWIKSFGAKKIVLGGQICKSKELFLPAIKRTFLELGINIPIAISIETERPAMKGVARKLINAITSGNLAKTAP
jgi:predicted NBD/HSP70 family sugar kinase